MYNDHDDGDGDVCVCVRATVYAMQRGKYHKDIYIYIQTHGGCYKLSVCAIAVRILLLLRTNKQILCKAVCTCRLTVCVHVLYVFEPHMFVLVVLYM